MSSRWKVFKRMTYFINSPLSVGEELLKKRKNMGKIFKGEGVKNKQKMLNFNMRIIKGGSQLFKTVSII